MFFWLPLSHHHRAQAHRCVMVPLGGFCLALCARCLGLYPTLFAALALQAWLRPPGLGAWDFALTLAPVLPGLFDWGSGLLDPKNGSNFRRLFTGFLLGAALGRGFWLYLADPKNEVFWTQMFVLLAGAMAFFGVRRIRPRGGI